MRAEAAERAPAEALERGSRARGPVTPADEPDPPEKLGEAAASAAERPSAPFAPETESEPRAAEPEPRPASEEPPPAVGSPDAVNLNTASFEELREADLSVTQATRILAYRERFGGYASVEDLERVPGFPAELVTGLGGRFTV